MILAAIDPLYDPLYDPLLWTVGVAMILIQLILGWNRRL